MWDLRTHGRSSTGPVCTLGRERRHKTNVQVACLSVGSGVQLHVMKRNHEALAGVAQWTKCQPVNQRVAGSIPSQGTCLGYGPGPQ